MDTITRSKILPPAMSTPAAGDWRGRRRRLPWVLAIVLLWIERAEQRHALAALEAHQLRDIGVSRAEALAEAAKPFWRP